MTSGVVPQSLIRPNAGVNKVFIYSDEKEERCDGDSNAVQGKQSRDGRRKDVFPDLKFYFVFWWLKA